MTWPRGPKPIFERRNGGGPDGAAPASMTIEEILWEYAFGARLQVWVRPAGTLDRSYLGVFQVGERTIWEPGGTGRPWPDVRDEIAAERGYLPIICQVRPVPRADDEDIRWSRPCDGVGCAPKARRTGLCDDCAFLDRNLPCAAHVLLGGKCATCTDYSREGALCPRVM